MKCLTQRAWLPSRVLVDPGNVISTPPPKHAARVVVDVQIGGFTHLRFEVRELFSGNLDQLVDGVRLTGSDVVDVVIE